MSKTLKPNPFCGHGVHREMVEDDQHRDIVCDVECASEHVFRMSDEEWNSRPREERLEGLLRGAKGTIEQLRAVQNGCPLPSYEEAYRLANDEADRTIVAINAALKEEQ